MIQRPKMMRSILRLTIAAGITFLLAEGALRAFHAIHPTFLFHDSNYNRFRGRPHAHDYLDFRLNSDGFKDTEFVPEKKPHCYRILALGDSFAFGVVPYRDNYLTRLEQKLREAGCFEVYNFGIPCTSPMDYYALLKQEGLKFRPDLLLVNFFIGNDFTDEQVNRRHPRTDWSYVLTLVRCTVDILHKYEGCVIHGRIRYHDNQPSLKTAEFLNTETLRSSIYDPQSGDFEHQFTRSLAWIDNIQRLSSRNGVKLMIILLPDNLQVDPELQKKVIPLYRKRTGRSTQLDFDLPNRRLRHELDRRGIPCLDLLAAFRTETATRKLYKPNDTHWNIAGNTLAAEEIYRFLAAVPGQGFMNNGS